jgi:hypothetical protein
MHGKQFHVIGVAKNGSIELSYDTEIEADSKLIIIFDHKIKGQLQQRLRRTAEYVR